MIDSLTPEQEAMFPVYTKKWIDIGMRTDPCDFEKAIEAAKESYKLVGLPEPKVFLGPFNTPLESTLAAEVLETLVGIEFNADPKSGKTDNDVINAKVKELVAEKLKTLKDFKIKTDKFMYGNHDYWLSYYDYFRDVCNLEICKRLDGLQAMAKCCGWWIPLSGVCIFTHPPSEIHMENDVTHNANGPAIKFRGDFHGCDVFIWRGVRTSRNVIEKKFTAQDIDKEPNAELRRIMVEIYGQEKYIIDTNAEIVHQDDFGTLYKKDMKDDEAIWMVKVVNSTPEPDGTMKDYFIRVSPNQKTAKAAVASTWRNRDGSLVFKSEDDYDPSVQT